MGLARCDIHENDQDLYARFMGGLNCDIQDILDYKEWTRFSQLYHLALKAEREVQGHQHSFKGNSSKPFSPRSTSEKEKTSTLVPQVPEVSKPILQAPPTKKTSPLSTSSSGSANIICHRFKGMGHVMRDCPSSMPTLQQVMVGIRVLAMLKMNIELLLTFMQKKRQLRRTVKPLIPTR